MVLARDVAENKQAAANHPRHERNAERWKVVGQ
jgi:hypothetical protein